MTAWVQPLLSASLSPFSSTALCVLASRNVQSHSRLFSLPFSMAAPAPIDLDGPQAEAFTAWLKIDGSKGDEWLAGIVQVPLVVHTQCFMGLLLYVCAGICKRGDFWVCRLGRRVRDGRHVLVHLVVHPFFPESPVTQDMDGLTESAGKRAFMKSAVKRATQEFTHENVAVCSRAYLLRCAHGCGSPFFLYVSGATMRRGIYG